ncbi:unnamed protein product [Lasius platythorax]|uniref:THAP-type domain-containing protein n=1 Tax=Lasius platythorax TaxID=488582 RepID=A0AAV2NP76_9HYME
MNAKGGNCCAFTMCSNIGGRTENISFFRFPKDIERSKLWVEACGRQDLMKKTSEELYKNYRVCALHFSQKMFLNDLQNRLQSNAVPIREHNMQEDITPCNITPNQCNDQERLELPLESDILLLDHVVDHVEANTSNYIPNIEEKESKETQTDSTLSRNSPHKKLKFKKRNATLRKKIYKLQKKINTNIINTKNKIETQECIEQYFNLTDKFLPAPIAEFVKTQVRLHQQEKKELH